MNILIIEDDPQISRVMQRVLRDHTTTTVSSGEAAIETLQNATEEFNRILCDFNLEGFLTGFDVYTWLQTNRPELLGRFIFCTSHTELESVHPLMIAKPFSPSELYTLVIGPRRG